MKNQRDALLASLQRRHKAFLATGDPSSVLDERAVAECERLVDLVGEQAVNDPTRDDLLAQQAAGLIFWDRYRVLPKGRREIAATHAAVFLTAAHDAAPENTPADIDPFIRIGQGELPEPGTDPTVLIDAGVGSLQLWPQFGNLGFLAVGSIFLQVAATLASADHPRRAELLANLGNSLFLLSTQDGDVEGFDRAAAMLREAVAAASNTADRLHALNSLGGVLITAFQTTRDGSKLDEALPILEQVVATAAGTGIRRGEPLGFLGTALFLKAEHTGEDAPLHRSITLLREALDLPFGAAASRMEIAASLAQSLWRLGKRTGDPALLAEAEQRQREALETGGDGPTAQGVFHLQLGAILTSRAELTGEVSQLTEAVTVLRQATSLMPPEHASRLLLATSLAEALRLHSKTAAEDSVAELNEGIAVLREALVTMRETDGRRFLVQMNLGVLLAARGDATGGETDQRESIEQFRSAAASVPDGMAERSAILGQLGSALSIRGFATSDRPMLAEAIDLLRSSIELSSPASSVHGLMLDLLGNALTRLAMAEAGVDQSNRYDSALLNEAYEIYHEAARLLPLNHMNRADVLNNLGAAAQRQAHVRRGTAEEGRWLDIAVEMLRESTTLRLESEPWRRNSPERSGHLINLGTALRHQATLREDSEPLYASLAVWAEAATSVAAAAHFRVDAAVGWAVAAQAVQDRPQALHALTVAVELMPRLAARSFEPEQREETLGRYTGVVSLATAAALDVGEPARALELLEHGRAILLSQGLDSRGDLSELRAHRPDLADRFERLCLALDAEESPEPVALSGEGVLRVTAGRATADRRHELDREWISLVAMIREQPGFETFLVPPPIGELLRQAESGPVVVINVADHRADALLVTSDGLEVLSLPALDYAALREQIFAYGKALDEIRSGRAAQRPLGERKLLEVLDWLWDTITGPVLRQLGLAQPPGDGAVLPRIWWCPTGPLSLLPLHASGSYSGGRPLCSVMDFVVSSYTPTIRALGHARRSRRIDAPVGARLLAVAPDSAQGPELPAARREVESLAEFFADSRSLAGADATVEAVCTALRKCRWVHFACHGESDPLRPALSSLSMYDAVLTVRELSTLRLEGAELAVLSACETARGGKLVDEALHVTAALQLVGFSDVVGTLWPINDYISAQIADLFYVELLEGIDAGREPEAARALHAAVTSVRAGREHRPSLWAAHIHSGR
jgi:tetratricopeptide (TPR) repeat protein